MISSFDLHQEPQQAGPFGTERPACVKHCVLAEAMCLLVFDDLAILGQVLGFCVCVLLCPEGIARG